MTDTEILAGKLDLIHRELQSIRNLVDAIGVLLVIGAVIVFAKACL